VTQCHIPKDPNPKSVMLAMLSNCVKSVFSDISKLKYALLTAAVRKRTIEHWVVTGDLPAYRQTNLVSSMQ
jgi:hypothetical protein